MRKLLISTILSLSVLSSFSQKNEFGKQVKIVSKYKTTLPNASKLVYKPVIKDTLKQNPTFDYFFKAKPFGSSFNLIESEYPKYKESEVEILNGGYLRLGGGNYSHFDGELAYNNIENKKVNWGFFANSNSIAGDVDGVNVGFVDQSVMAYFTKFNRGESYGASVSYGRDLFHFLNVKNDYTDSRERRGDLNVSAIYNKVLDDDLKCGAKFSYTNFNDSFSSLVENYFELDTYGEVEVLGGNFRANLNIDYLFSENNFFSVSLNPSYKAKWGLLGVDIGFGLTDLISEKSKLYIYPKINISADVFEKYVGIYALIDGGLTYNNYFKSYKINPFVVVASDEFVEPTYNKMTLGGGIKGRFDDLFWYNVYCKYSDIEGYNSYVLDRDKYSEIMPFMQKSYDVKLFTFGAEVGVNIDKNLSVVSDFKYYSFDMQSLEKPFNVPDFELTFRGKYVFDKQLSLGADLIVLGERDFAKYDEYDIYSKDGTNGIAFDLNVNAEYKFSKYLYVFGKVNNILNQNYERWESYPSIGINFLAGFTITF